jgi:hypothetical protein
MGITNYLAKAILKHVVGLGAAPTGDVYLALGTSSPNASDEDTWSGELSGSGYARQLIPMGPVASHAITNSADVVFPEATANWGSVSHYGLWVGGKLLAYAPFGPFGSPSPVTVNTGEVLRVKANQLSVAPFSGLMSYYLEDHLLNGCNHAGNTKTRGFVGLRTPFLASVAAFR